MIREADLYRADRSRPADCRPATVAECRKALAASRPSDRRFGQWFFPLHVKQQPDDIRRWLARNAPKPEGT